MLGLALALPGGRQGLGLAASTRGTYRDSATPSKKTARYPFRVRLCGSEFFHLTGRVGHAFVYGS